MGYGEGILARGGGRGTEAREAQLLGEELERGAGYSAGNITGYVIGEDL